MTLFKLRRVLDEQVGVEEFIGVFVRIRRRRLGAAEVDSSGEELGRDLEDHGAQYTTCHGAVALRPDAENPLRSGEVARRLNIRSPRMALPFGVFGYLFRSGQLRRPKSILKGLYDFRFDIYDLRPTPNNTDAQKEAVFDAVQDSMVNRVK